MVWDILLPHSSAWKLDFSNGPRCVSHGGLKDLDCSGNGLGDNGVAEVVEVRSFFCVGKKVRWQSNQHSDWFTPHPGCQSPPGL